MRSSIRQGLFVRKTYYPYRGMTQKRVRRCTILGGIPLVYGIDGGTDCIEIFGYLLFGSSSLLTD